MHTDCNDAIENDHHPWACDAAVAAECANRQGPFWPMHDLLFKNQHRLAAGDLEHYAREAGVDVEAWRRCCSDAPVDNPSEEPVAYVAPSCLEGRPLPEFRGSRMPGGQLASQALCGKVTYVSFFASWCPPCRRELPALVRLYERYAERGFQVVAVGVDAGSPERSAALARRYRPAFPVLLDPTNTILGKLDVQSMPTSYLVGRSGIVRHRQVGFGKDTFDEMAERIERLLP